MTTAKVERFEDLEVWQKARMLVRQIYTVTKNRAFREDYILRDQMRRAAISVMGNIAEGFGRQTPKEFAQFLIQSHGSAAEIQSHLYAAARRFFVNYMTRLTKFLACCDASSDYLRRQPQTRTPHPERRG